MVVFSLGFRFPGCNGGQSLIGAAFIPDNGVGCEAFEQRVGITGVFEGVMDGRNRRYSDWGKVGKVNLRPCAGKCLRLRLDRTE
jgi:hypothetical protein